MSEYIALEIDLENLDMLIQDASAADEYWSAKNNNGLNAAKTAWDTTANFYNTQGEWFQTLGTKFQKVSNKIHQKTLQRRPTALDRVNVRRLMFYLEKNIRIQSRSLLFDPHTEQLRELFVDLCKGILQNVVTNQGIYDYVVKCDAELNTADVIDRNEMRARIGVQPVKAAEFIFIEFSLHRTGSFTENTEVVV